MLNTIVNADVLYRQWLAGNPASLIADNFLITKDDVARLPRKSLGIIK